MTDSQNEAAKQQQSQSSEGGPDPEFAKVLERRAAERDRATPTRNPSPQFNHPSQLAR